MNFNYLFPSIVAQDFFDDHNKFEKNLVNHIIKLKKKGFIGLKAKKIPKDLSYLKGYLD